MVDASAGFGVWNDWPLLPGAADGTLGGFSIQYARFCQVNNIVHINGQFSVDPNGTGATALQFSLPTLVNPAIPETPILAWLTSSVPIVLLWGLIIPDGGPSTSHAATGQLLNLDLTYPGADATGFTFSGFYEALPL